VASVTPNPCGISCIVQLHAWGPGITNERIQMKSKPLTLFQLLERIVTAVNIATGDDGSKAKKVVDNFCLFLKMDEKKYKEQQKYYG